MALQSREKVDNGILLSMSHSPRNDALVEGKVDIGEFNPAKTKLTFRKTDFGPTIFPRENLNFIN